MSDIVPSLNEAAADLGQLVVERTAVSVTVLAVVIVIGLLLRQRASAHLLSWLWLLPLVPLVAPVEELMPALRPGAGPQELAASALQDPAPPTLAPRAASSTPQRGSAPALVEGRVSGHAQDGAVTVTYDATSSALTALTAIWALVAITLLARFVVAQVRTRRDVLATPMLVDHPAAGLLRELLPIAGVRRPVRLAVSAHVHSPATWGCRHPVIFMPEPLLEKLDATQLRWVLLHELAHVRRGDLWIAPLQRLVQIAWWFHPLVWLVSARVADHRECACDDTASARCDAPSRRPCAEAFLEVVTFASHTHTPYPAGASLVHGSSLMKKRLMRLLDKKRTVSRGTSLAALLVIIICGAFSLTLARAQEHVMETDGAARVQDAGAPEASEIVARAATWLLAHQQEDGHWPVTFEKDRKFNGMETEVSTTATAVLALIDAEMATKRADIATGIDRAVAWLEAQQTPAGGLGPRTGPVWTYAHVMGTLALCAAQRRAPHDPRLDVLIKASEFIEAIRNPYAGWRYGYRDGDNDSKMTSLMLLALTELTVLGVPVDQASLDGGQNVIEQMTSKVSGRVGWVRPGGPPGRLFQTKDSHPADLSEEVTALALVMQRERGLDFKPDGTRDRGVKLVLARTPEWNEKKGTLDYAYWYWAARLAAGLPLDRGKKWCTALRRLLTEHAAKDAKSPTIWPLKDAWSLPGLEVATNATCLRALCATL